MNQDKHLSFRQRFKQEQKHTTSKKKHWGLLVIPCFIMVFFMASFFNFQSGFATNPQGTTLGEKFYLSGPDPYYNMRVLEETMKTGSYPFTQPHQGNADPLLNYPVGERGSRPPLFVCTAVVSTLFLQNFMPQVDAMGWSMEFLPVLWGALLVIPLYFIGRALFNRKVGLISCSLLPFIPVFIGGGHGAGFSLFDHDSFLQLLFCCVFLFVILMLKAISLKKAIFYSSIAGLFSGAIYLTWTASQMIYLVLLVSLLSLLIFSLLKKTDSKNIFISFVILSVVAFLVGLPWSYITSDVFGFPLFMVGISFIVLCFYYVTTKIKIPWILSIPFLVISGFGSLLLLFLQNIGILNLGGRLYQLSIFFFGEGIYGSKISLTIAEAHSISLSGTVMSIGPVIYWLGLLGFSLYFVKTYRDRFKPENVFMICLFLVLLWLVTTAGRFLNDIVPYIVLFCAWSLLIIIDKLKFNEMKKTIQAIGFLRGIKRSFTAVRILGVLFIVIGVFVLNGFLALDAAIPAVDKEKYFGKDYQGYFGQSLGQSYYWSDACSWLAKQDTNISLDKDKPAVISWWDYGFYLASQSRHPTVADNYQDGIPPASNFHTASSENEAVCVLIIRCLEGASFKSNYNLSFELKQIIRKNLPDEKKSMLVNNETINYTVFPSKEFIAIFQDPIKYAPSYDTLIEPEYRNTQLRVKMDNARYHDCCKTMQNLTDEQVTNFYSDVKEATGFDIRYYAVEQYDTQIFNVFSFLSDKSTFGFVTQEDRYMSTYYEDSTTGQVYFYDQISELTEDVLLRLIQQQNYKPAYFETMFYRTYYGTNSTRIPTYLLKHFSLEYVTPYVVIAKYSEGAKVKGYVSCNSTPYYGAMVVVFDKNNVPHDYSYTESDGSYSLLFPEGNCSIGMMVGSYRVNITESIKISENEAQRKTNHSEIENITVGFSSAEISVITNRSGLMFSMFGNSFGKEASVNFSLNNTFHFDEVYPDVYSIRIQDSNGTSLLEKEKFLDYGNNSIILTI